VLFLFVRRQLSSGVEDPLLVERRLQLPVFGSILFSNEQARLNRGVGRMPLLSSNAGARGNEAHMPAMEVLSADATAQAARPLLAMYRAQDLSMEALRGVRAVLQFDLSDAPNKVLVVTGPTPGTGKSFVSANLAVLQAESGKRVLLIDGDLRRGLLASDFGLPNAGGLSELLAGQIEPPCAIRPAGVEGLSFIAAGRYPSNPSELLSSPRLQHLLEEFSAQFDLVIIDTPPVLAVTDANIVSAQAGSTVLVLRPNVQTKRELEETMKRLNRAGARVVGAIFNAMPPRRSEKRSYQYIHAYTANAIPQHCDS
jgi:tyrosine-protein kinase Etk/Wzc